MISNFVEVPSLDLVKKIQNLYTHVSEEVNQRFKNELPDEMGVLGGDAFRFSSQFLK